MKLKRILSLIFLLLLIVMQFTAYATEENYIPNNNGESNNLPTNELESQNKKSALIVNHILVDIEGNELARETTVIEDLEVGKTVYGSNYAFNLENFEFIKFKESIPEELVLSDVEENIVNLYYELNETDGENVNIDVENAEIIEVYDMDSPDIIDGYNNYEPYTEDNNREMFTLSNTQEPQYPNQGAIRAVKQATWINQVTGEAKVVFDVDGVPIKKGADVVLVLDKSGSMGEKVSEEICNTPLTYGNVYTDFWGIMYKDAICSNCGKKYTATSRNNGNTWKNNPQTCTAVISTINRLDLLKEAANEFVNTMFIPNADGTVSANRIGLVSFSSTASKDVPISSMNDIVDNTDAKSALISKINNLTHNGGTNYTNALTSAEQLINGRTDKTRPAYIVFITDGRPDPNNSSTDGISISNTLKGNGVTIYSIGLALTNTSDIDRLKNIASSDADNPTTKLYYDANDGSNLATVFNNIANNIKIAGTNAIITDVINTMHFDLDNSKTIVASRGTVQVNPDNKTIVWNLGNITSQKATLTIYVKLKPEYLNILGSYYTNESAIIDYKNYNDVPNVQKPINANPIPLQSGQITIIKYLVNDTGKPINNEGTIINDFTQITKLDTSLYLFNGSTNLALGNSYTVTADNEISVNGKRYQYIPLSSYNGGTISPANISVTYDNPSNTVYYGYKEVENSYLITFDNGLHGSITPPINMTINSEGNLVYENLIEGSNHPIGPEVVADIGYKFDGWYEGETKITTFPTTVSSNHTYVAMWSKDDTQTVKVKYTVEHWVAGDHKTADDVVVTKDVWVNDAKVLAVTAGSLAPKTYAGYKFSAYDPTDITANKVVASDTVIKVNYVKDDTQTIKIKYTVEHWVAGEHKTTDDVVITKDVWVNDAKELAVTTGSLSPKTYAGYKFSAYDPTDITANKVVASDTVIKVNYVKDDTQTVKVKYTVEHWVAGEHKTADDVVVIKDVWVNDAKELAVTAISLTPKTYEGYKFSAYDPTDITIGSVVANNSVIKVNYVKDNTQTVKVKYTVEHWVAGEHKTADDVVITKDVWVNDAKELAVTAGSLTPKTYEGYKFSTYDPTDITIGSVVANNSVIKVNYVKDEEQTKELSYTIEYYKDGTLAETDTDKEIVWINAPNTLAVDKVDIANNKYVGYKFDHTDPTVVPETIADGSIIKAYYIKDESQIKELSYTIEYYKDGVLAETDTDKEIVWINAPNTLAVDKVDTANNKYVGYKFDHTDPTVVPETTSNGSIIKVYYVINKYTVITHVTPVAGGTTKGDGIYNHGAQVTITATPNSGYYFVEWKLVINEDNTPRMVATANEISVSDKPNYMFTIENDMEYIAVFKAYTPQPEPSTYEVKIIYKDLDTDKDIRKPYVFYSESGSTIKASNQVKQVDGYKYVSASVDKITVKSNSSLNVITLYYEKTIERNLITYNIIELNKEDHFAYIVGYPEGDIRPLNTITREEVATIFYRLLTDESREKALSYSNGFTDIGEKRWSNIAISTLYNSGIINGYEDGTFRPEQPITRAEFATIASRFDKLEESNKDLFTDVKGHWARTYINSSAIKGWIKGYPDKTFNPNKNITRAEAMTLINAVLDRIVEKENIHKDAKKWPDVKKDAWYYEEVFEATNSHDYKVEDENEVWLNIKENKVWP